MHDEIKLGNRIHQGNTVITLPDLKEMQVLIQVHEADIDLVKLEQPVRVTLEAIKERVFDAKVTRIGAVANSNWGNPENKTFEVEVTMQPIDVELRAGTTANADIQVETLTDVVHVPIHAVFVESGEHFAFVAATPSLRSREDRRTTITSCRCSASARGRRVMFAPIPRRGPGERIATRRRPSSRSVAAGAGMNAEIVA
jgi:hypothetical protein